MLAVPRGRRRDLFEERHPFVAHRATVSNGWPQRLGAHRTAPHRCSALLDGYVAPARAVDGSSASLSSGSIAGSFLGSCAAGTASAQRKADPCADGSPGIITVLPIPDVRLGEALLATRELAQ